jgi:hypothetical protein
MPCHCIAKVYYQSIRLLARFIAEECFQRLTYIFSKSFRAHLWILRFSLYPYLSAGQCQHHSPSASHSSQGIAHIVPSLKYMQIPAGFQDSDMNDSHGNV